MAVEMGYLPSFFWHLTHAEFLLLLHGWKKQQELQDRRVARICATIYNTAPYKKKPLSEDDFIPKFKQRKAQSTEEMLAFIKAMQAVWSGGDLK